jgi:hypothetical protein
MLARMRIAEEDDEFERAFRSMVSVSSQGNSAQLTALKIRKGG